MQCISGFIYDVIHGNDEFSKEFMDKIAKMENEDFLDVDDLDELFEWNTKLNIYALFFKGEDSFWMIKN